MSNNYFQFKQFTVYHNLCAMKVGTDGVLLGAWAQGGKHILDIGTGTGLIALFMAQRYPKADITGIDIDFGACQQATANAAISVFDKRIHITCTAVQDYSATEQFDAIVCNPPFYKNSLPSANQQRTLARQATSLPTASLMRHVTRLLTEGGEFSVIIPAANKAEFDTEALMNGLSASRVCAINTVPYKPVSRYLLAYTKCRCNTTEETEACINDEYGEKSEWYTTLTKDFYIGL